MECRKDICDEDNDFIYTYKILQEKCIYHKYIMIQLLLIYICLFQELAIGERLFKEGKMTKHTCVDFNKIQNHHFYIVSIFLF